MNATGERSSLEREQKRTQTNHPANVGKTEKLICTISGSALTIYGLTQRSPRGLMLTALGAGMLHRGLTGHCEIYHSLGIDRAKGHQHERVARDIHVEKAVNIDRSPEELYRFWRDFQNLPRFMKNVEAVIPIDEKRSHWRVKGPAGVPLEWDAEIYNEKENELISWRALQGADIVNAGTVRFERAPQGRGAYVKVTMNYNAPGGRLSALIAKLSGNDPSRMVEEDLRRFKQVIEAGEIATTEGQPSGRSPEAAPLKESKADRKAVLPERQRSMTHAA
jgi:uncharacterized membrane protein